MKLNHIFLCLLYTGILLFSGGAIAAPDPDALMPPGAKLVFEEDWATGEIAPEKWYALHKRWGRGNNGAVSRNVFIGEDTVNGTKKNVLICRGHGDRYTGPVVGWEGNAKRVGGVIVSRPFFASGRFEVILKIGDKKPSPKGPEDSTRPIGMVPAIWTYAYRWEGPGEGDPKAFNPSNPLYNPYLKNEYWSELDFPEFGKNQNLEIGLYNTFITHSHHSLEFSTKDAIDGNYHVFTTIWRTHLVPMEGVADSQVTKAEGYWWVQDKAIPFAEYRGNPLKRLGKDRYAVYAGKEAVHFIDGIYVGTNSTYVPVMAAQLNIGVWFPGWGGAAPWEESTMSIASVKVWQFFDEGDVRGILTEDIPDNMDAKGRPLRR